MTSVGFFSTWAVMLNILIIFKSNNAVQPVWAGIKHSSFFIKFQLEVLKTAVSSPHNPAFSTFCKTSTCLLRFKIRDISPSKQTPRERNLPLGNNNNHFLRIWQVTETIESIYQCLFLSFLFPLFHPSWRMLSSAEARLFSLLEASGCHLL